MFRKVTFVIVLFFIALPVWAAPSTQNFLNIQPFTTDTYDNGTSTNRWFHVFTKFASTTGLTVSGQTSGCAQFDLSGFLTSVGTNCGTGSGTVTQINTTFPILGGPITTTGTISFGGLGTSSPWNAGQLGMVVNNTTLIGVSTTSVSCSGSTSCSAFTVIGSSPVTISGGTIFGEAWQLGLNTFGQSGLTPTTTQNIMVNGIGTSTFKGGVEGWRQISAPYFNATSTATSTFEGGIKTLRINTSGTSTTAGIELTSGCFSVGGACLQPSGAGNSKWATSTVDTTVISPNSATAIGIGTDNPRGVNANSLLTVAKTGAADIIASSTDNTTSSAAIFNAYAPGSRIFIGAHGASQVTTQYGIVAAGYGELGCVNSTFGTSNGCLIGTATTNTPIIFGTNSLERLRIAAYGAVGIGTSTPRFALQIASSTGPQLALGDTSLTSNPWTFRSINGNLYISTSSPTTFATSTLPAFTLDSTQNALFQGGMVGMGTSTPSATSTLTIQLQNMVGLRDSPVKVTVSGSGNDALYITNNSTTDGVFQGGLTSYVESTNAGSVLANNAFVSSLVDQSDSSTPGLVNFVLARSNNPLDPANGTLSAIQNRKLFTVSNVATTIFEISAGATTTLVASAAATSTNDQLNLRSDRQAITAGELIGGITFQSNDTTLTAPGIVVAKIDATANATHTGTVLDTFLSFFTTTGTTLAERMRISETGNVGLGTTSPIAEFVSVAASTTAGTPATGYNGVVHIIAGLQNTVVKLFQVIDQWGRRITGGDAPALSSCGTTPSFVGAANDNTMSVQVGSVAATGCTATFAHPWVAAPTCNVTNRSMSVVNAMTYTVSATAVVVSQTGLTSAILDIQCTGTQ